MHHSNFPSKSLSWKYTTLYFAMRPIDVQNALYSLKLKLNSEHNIGVLDAQWNPDHSTLHYLER
jgi:hypothetical protein